MAFLEVQFPTDISFGSLGGPEYQTDVIVIGSGYEKRNARWPIGRHRYNVAYGARTQATIESLIDFFQACQGRAHGFRYQDPMDYKSCSIMDDQTYLDQSIGTGDGVETDFQLYKSYTKGSQTVTRTINKPISGTVLVGEDGVNQAAGWTVDTTTGVISFAVAPADTLEITAGFEFDVPCRFDTDYLNIGIRDKAGYKNYISDTDIPVIEILL
jgi:uncharacterized protein (TIGR02217 family)